MKKGISIVLAGVLACTSLLAGCSSGKTANTAASASGSSAASASAGGQTYTFRYAENQAKDYPTTQAAYKFADLVSQKTNGRIKVQVYYGAQLGDEKSVVEQLQYGGIDFSRVSLSPLAEFDKELNVLQLPYLYSSSDQMWKVLDGSIGNKFLAGVKSAKLVGLSWFAAGARNFYTKKQVKTLADLKGLKIRVQESSMMMDMVKALGASPTPMDYGEVYSALQNGVVDGAENNWPSYDSTNHYEVAKYYLLDGHTRVPEMQLCSQATWNKLSDSDKKIVQECATESAKLERQLWAEQEKKSEDKVKKAGSVVTELSPEELKKFQDAVKPLYSKYAKDYMDTVKQIQETK